MLMVYSIIIMKILCVVQYVGKKWMDELLNPYAFFIIVVNSILVVSCIFIVSNNQTFMIIGALLLASVIWGIAFGFALIPFLIICQKITNDVKDAIGRCK